MTNQEKTIRRLHHLQTIILTLMITSWCGPIGIGFIYGLVSWQFGWSMMVLIVSTFYGGYTILMLDDVLDQEYKK